MRILHVSDLHASDVAAGDGGDVLASFFESLAHDHSDTPIEAVVFTGDLARTGRADEYALAEARFLSPLQAALGLSPGHIVIVPGNHDIDRDRIDRFTDEGLRNGLTSSRVLIELFESGDVERYLDRLQDFNAFHSRFYSAASPQPASALAHSHRVPTSAGEVGIAALNSSWRATGSPNNGDRGHLLIGDRQVRECLSHLDDCVLLLAVMHHPLDWLAPFDTDDVQRLLDRKIDIILCGHLHEPNAQQIAGLRGTAIHSRAGCLYDGEDFPNAYTLIDVDLEAGSVIVRLKRYFPSRPAFDDAIDIVATGSIEFPLQVRGNETPVVPSIDVPHSTVLSTLVDVAQETSIVGDHLSRLESRSVAELLVPPRCLPVPYEQAVAALDPATDHKPAQLSILDEFTKSRCVIVEGRTESGLTSTLLWTLDAKFTTEERGVPIYLSFGDMGPGKDPVGREVEKALSRFHGIDFGASGPPLLIAVDDVTPRRPKALRRLARFIAENEVCEFVLACHEGESDTIDHELSEAGVSARRVFLGPFGRRELKDLARKYLGGLDQALVDRVLETIRNENLPRSPYLMAILVVVLDAGDLPANERSETAIVDRYINLLLGRVASGEDPRIALDYRNYEHILAAIAEKLVVADTDRIGRLDLEDFLVDYFRSKGWQSSPGKVVDVLIEKRMLIEKSEYVRFRHPALRNMFIAKRLLESESFRTAVLEQPLKFASALRHASALSRSDRELLVRIGALLDECRADLDGLDESYFPRIAEPPGWSRDLDLEGAARALRPVPEASPETLDEHLDEMWDRDLVEKPEVDQELTSVGRFVEAVDLLSNVLRHSELVDDVTLKTNLLKESLRSWATVAVIIGAAEDQSSDGRNLLEALLRGTSTITDEEEFQRGLEYIVKGMIVLTAGMGALYALGSVKLVDLLDTVLDDEAFMSEASNALFATFVYAHLAPSNRGRRLQQLLDTHGSDLLLMMIVKFLALLAYHREILTHDEETAFENLLVDIALREQRLTDPRERGKAREFLVRSLRLQRLQAKAQHRLERGGLLEVEMGETDDEDTTPEVK